MKIAVFCASEPRHVYFTNNLCGHLPIDRIFVEQKPSIYDGERLKREARFFFSSQKKPCFNRNDLVHKVTDINCHDIDTYLSCGGDILICTFGCSIIKMGSAFRKNVKILNLHSGILPEYRGVHCVFWSLYNREPDMVGGSIHLINRRIDAGDIMAKVFPDISPDDNEESLFNKTIKLGAEEFVKAIRFIYKHRSLIAEPQLSSGQVYFAKDRTRARESKLNSMLRDGLLLGFHRKERRERFYEKMGKNKKLRGSCRMVA